MGHLDRITVPYFLCLPMHTSAGMGPKEKHESHNSGHESAQNRLGLYVLTTGTAIICNVQYAL